MLTLDMLYAVLQGLTSNYLGHLDRVWISFCVRIQLALEEGKDPISALKLAFQKAQPWELYSMKEALREVMPVMRLPGLSYRQKETLIALRCAKVASLSQLTRVLLEDRSNTHKRLTVLVRRGLAVKFFQPDGVYYFAVPAPLEKEVKSAVSQMIDQFLEELAPTTPTTATTPTTLTTPTTATMAP